jgi:hypothetical protein
MIKIKSTQVPKNRIIRPYSNPGMIYINDYWTQSDTKFNHDLYLKIIKVKKEQL